MSMKNCGTKVTRTIAGVCDPITGFTPVANVARVNPNNVVVVNFEMDIDIFVAHARGVKVLEGEEKANFLSPKSRKKTKSDGDIAMENKLAEMGINL